uniref:ATP synthase subunit a n=4 Tax=Formica TaxID=72766 RepID=A0A872YMX6_9HYME|nr:ATP synthase F0 subunit 6 [Formica glauca]QNV12000.1 ATP synthase F0 subunit 6 [Formica rufibarbis]QOY24473.1 ATP synthase F0 subunit 6 [Formica sp. DM656]QOY24488.1 ATP synthase F0 subunit 6 [Formica sp. DM658]QOY24500.1 ATP synthase F0 subunit 6 [Formica sp. DM659]WAK85252.1 ATP synthase F0 subunit 6 [Formica glauca]
MMMNLFSIFDPSTSLMLSLNWLSMLMIFFMFPYQFWLIPSRYIMMWNLLMNFLFKEFKILINYSYSNLIIFLSLFSLIIISNLMGLFPYIFTISSQLSFCLSLSLTLWISMILYSMFNYLNELFAHLTPQGTPFILMPFMVIIESISLMIRPFTLAIRLTANMIAGHLLLSLLGSSGEIINNKLIFLIMIFSQLLLLILEISVSIIQAYVFSILSTLYSSEI